MVDQQKNKGNSQRSHTRQLGLSCWSWPLVCPNTRCPLLGPLYIYALGSTFFLMQTRAAYTIALFMKAFNSSAASCCRGRPNGIVCMERQASTKQRWAYTLVFAVQLGMPVGTCRLLPRQIDRAYLQGTACHSSAMSCAILPQPSYTPRCSQRGLPKTQAQTDGRRKSLTSHVCFVEAKTKKIKRAHLSKHARPPPSRAALFQIMHVPQRARKQNPPHHRRHAARASAHREAVTWRAYTNLWDRAGSRRASQLVSAFRKLRRSPTTVGSTGRA